MSSTGPAGGHGPSAAGGQQTKATGTASKLHGHYKYAKGAVEQTLGKVTGATELQSAGKADQTAGLTEIQAARQHIEPQCAARPVTSTSNSDTTVVAGGGVTAGSIDSGTQQRMSQPATSVPGPMSMEGNVERTVGNLFQCKGMQDEGVERVASAEALRRNKARVGGSGGIEGSLCQPD
ncbi:hypothetical protein EV426DRAFT_603042 [Tirmania nivea]|nr:hypothetical protein EV426DRAFT_603042 [Tirmania nivea]